ncbi:hypothetical protein HYALB_00003832 [Hymenoscyphus albidus]|uniref:Uncharacterized protein n=1 Tax=Hymenoscyphus albidus TaxID=595503 RepID=A0A9N9LZB8_9HELO|nr:hypothetical protein HYALB_00003832 [Hymenoscyphus albidus]
MSKPVISTENRGLASALDRIPTKNDQLSDAAKSFNCTRRTYVETLIALKAFLPKLLDLKPSTEYCPELAEKSEVMVGTLSLYACTGCYSVLGNEGQKIQIVNREFGYLAEIQKFHHLPGIFVPRAPRGLARWEEGGEGAYRTLDVKAAFSLGHSKITVVIK